jgi:hypothetical protein
MQRGKHQVAGQSRLDGHIGGLAIADLTDHDDVRILAQQRAHAIREAQVDVPVSRRGSR